MADFLPVLSSGPATFLPMIAYEALQNHLRANPLKWLVTGGAGFIGSHLVEKLLSLGQQVIVLDNLATGKRSNLDDAIQGAPIEHRGKIRFVKGDITDKTVCHSACAEVDYVLHQAGLGSVPRSIEKPAETHAANLTGTLNMLVAARDAGVKRMVYASSSSVYGDDPTLPKVEGITGNPLSPYAASKAMCETYSQVFHRCYGFESLGLRYFNVFGPRQDPEGAYAAVLPKWLAALKKGEPVFINGDGETSRDFCYVANVVQANLLAATSDHRELGCQAFNVARGDRTSLNDLYKAITASLKKREPSLGDPQPVYRDFRAGDILHSQADISSLRRLTGYSPTHDVRQG
ncbi:MAG: NAD-dependent epimerase/dehydratase, partial [Verrucomicrobiaceae bacterium]|nr:NAD-dependent epimerase/dehydratase [Verrucomicrobiaceae bacterium]